MKKSYYFSIWACTIWGILVALNYSYFQGDKQNMDDTTVDFIQKLIIAILPALITGLLTFFIGKKSRINNLSNNIDELKNLIGSQEGTTLTKYVSDTFNSIKEDIGRQDRGSLSKQHDNLQNMLKKEIEAGEKFDEVIAIGPLVMMKFVCKLTEQYNIPTTVSMNPVMIDGTGMCGGCRVIVGGETKFACVDGPDFDGHKIDWDTAMKRGRMFKDYEEKSCKEGHCRIGRTNHQD